MVSANNSDLKAEYGSESATVMSYGSSSVQGTSYVDNDVMVQADGITITSHVDPDTMGSNNATTTLSSGSLHFNLSNGGYAGIGAVEDTTDGSPSARIQVNGALEPINGIYLTSPNGNTWKIVVDDNGSLSTVAVQ